jgi:hypothetical protein
MMGGTTFPEGGPHPISEETAMAIMAAAQGGANLDSLVARIEDLERRLTEAEAEINELKAPSTQALKALEEIRTLVLKSHPPDSGVIPSSP